jgi:hypothetical protein
MMSTLDDPPRRVGQGVDKQHSRWAIASAQKSCGLSLEA